ATISACFTAKPLSVDSKIEGKRDSKYREKEGIHLPVERVHGRGGGRRAGWKISRISADFLYIRRGGEGGLREGSQARPFCSGKEESKVEKKGGEEGGEKGDEKKRKVRNQMANKFHVEITENKEKDRIPKLDYEPYTALSAAKGFLHEQ